MLRRVVVLTAAVAVTTGSTALAQDRATRLTTGQDLAPTSVHAPWPEVAVIGYPNFYTYGTSAGYPNAYTFGGTRAVPVVARGVRQSGTRPISVSDHQASMQGPRVIVVSERTQRASSGPRVIRVDR